MPKIIQNLSNCGTANSISERSDPLQFSSRLYGNPEIRDSYPGQNMNDVIDRSMARANGENRSDGDGYATTEAEVDEMSYQMASSKSAKTRAEKKADTYIPPPRLDALKEILEEFKNGPK